MAQPRLLLIDDEPALADFLANAARECGFEPDRHRPTTPNSASTFSHDRPKWSRSTSECRGWTASSCSASSPNRIIAAPVLIVSGFDRRVLESAFRLGEALGLNMVGPVEKPVRLEVLEEVLSQLRGDARADEPQGDERSCSTGFERALERAASAHGLPAEGRPSRRRA